MLGKNSHRSPGGDWETCRGKKWVFVYLGLTRRYKNSRILRACSEESNNRIATITFTYKKYIYLGVTDGACVCKLRTNESPKGAFLFVKRVSFQILHISEEKPNASSTTRDNWVSKRILRAHDSQKNPESGGEMFQPGYTPVFATRGGVDTPVALSTPIAIGGLRLNPSLVLRVNPPPHPRTFSSRPAHLRQSCIKTTALTDGSVLYVGWWVLGGSAVTGRVIQNGQLRYIVWGSGDSGQRL